MPFPDGLDTAQVSGQIVGYADGEAAATFTSPGWLIGEALVPSFTVTATINEDGEFTVELPWTENSAWTPTEWTYEVRLDYGTQILRGSLAVPENTVTMDLEDGFNPDTEPSPGQTYALVGHTHPIEDVNDLQTQLDGKQPVGTYLEPDDISNLVSYDTMTEELADYLPEIAPVVTDSTLTVVRSGGGAARWRSTGGALDIDVVGDVIESRFANQDFTGTQTGLRRMRAAGNTLAGRTEFGSTPYLAEQAIDASTGRADLGAKNSASNLQVCGYLAIATAPTSGTWAVGDVVATQIGLFRCSVAGTPGTWVPMWREQALDKGYVAWNGDPGQSVQAGTIVPTSGLSFVFRLRALGALISRIQMHCTTTATSVTNAWCTLHDDNGLILNANAKSDANQNTAFQSGGMKSFTFVAPQVVTPGAFYRARVWFTTSGTLPTISRMCNSSTAIINPDISGTAASTPYGWASADSSLTDLASAPDQIGNLTGTGTAWWMGAK